MNEPELNVLLDTLEDNGTIGDPATVMGAFVDWAGAGGRPLYPHQQDAAVAVFAGSHVIATTPTGSGKSMIALAAHLHSLAQNGRTYYTAPIKALVSEKFFELSDLFGAQNVGMVTGDVSINSDAPIVCCTAEIVANMALREGEKMDAHTIVMDEFHFYADPDRGWAWQVPLLELPHVQFVLLSATLGDVSFFVDFLTRHTGRDVSVIDNAKRPVPLYFNYTLEDLPTLVGRLLEEDKYPMYVVHFSQAAAVTTAQNLASTSIISREARDRVAQAIKNVKFASGFGVTLAKLLKAGIGVHHAGMLPRYRRVVEQLTAQGLLSVICGTDTLGVGINVPIRCVVFTGLAKYDGSRERHLSAREFHQIAGRAGRAGYDTVGYVEVQAPEHDIENFKRANRLAFGGKNGERGTGLEPPKHAKKNAPKKSAKEGTVSWTQQTFERLTNAQPEALRSRFKFTHAMVLNVLSGHDNPMEHLVFLAQHNHDGDGETPKHMRQLLNILLSLHQADVLAFTGVIPADYRENPQEFFDLLDVADLPQWIACFTLAEPLEADFALNQELSPFALAAFDLLDNTADDYALDLLSVVESVLEDPMPVLLAQRKAARDAQYAALKASGATYDEIQEELAEITWPRPLDDLLEGAFSIYQKSNPWAIGMEVKPKSVVRDMIESAMTFSDLIARYGIARSEGVVLRYITDAFRALRQIVTEDLRTQELLDIIEWLGQLINSVDSSLLQEWQQLADGSLQGTKARDVLNSVGIDAANHGSQLAFGANPDGTMNYAAQPQVLRRLVVNAVWPIVELLGADRADRLETRDYCGWSYDEWDGAIGAFLDDHDALEIGQDARSNAFVSFAQNPAASDVTTLLKMIDSDDCVGGADLNARIKTNIVNAGPETVTQQPTLGAHIMKLCANKALWVMTQTLKDSEADLDYKLYVAVDVNASQRHQKAVIYPLMIGPFTLNIAP